MIFGGVGAGGLHEDGGRGWQGARWDRAVGPEGPDGRGGGLITTPTSHQS